MGHARGVINLRNGWPWLGKIHTGRGYDRSWKLTLGEGSTAWLATII